MRWLTQEQIQAIKDLSPISAVLIGLFVWRTTIWSVKRKEGFDQRQKQNELHSKFHLERKQALLDILVAMRESANHMVNANHLRNEHDWHLSQDSVENAKAYAESYREVKMKLYNSLPLISGRCQFYGLIPGRVELDNRELFTYFEGIYHVAIYHMLTKTDTSEDLLKEIQDNISALERNIGALIDVEEQLAADCLHNHPTFTYFEKPKLEYMRKVGDRVKRKMPDVRKLELPESVTSHYRFEERKGDNKV